MFSSFIARVILLALFPMSALGAPIQYTPRQLDQLTGLLGGAQAGQGANPLGALGGAGGLDGLLGQFTGGNKQVSQPSQ